MITYEQALEMAETQKENIDSCIEYENGYGFFCKDDSNFIGGWDHIPVIVMKDGRFEHHTIAFEGMLGEEIRSISVR